MESKEHNAINTIVFGEAAVSYAKTE